jgi:RND family efflux transporter MFP subunit
MKKWITIILLAVFLSLVGVKVYMKILEQGGGYSAGKRGKPVAVELARVRSKTIRDISEFTGSLKPRNRFLLAAKIPGRLQQLKVNIGDKLTYGQLVAVLDDHEYQQQLEQARALLEVARANSRAAFQSVTISTRELSRVKSLRSSNISTVSELDTARDSFALKKVAYEVAKAQLSEKKASFKLAQIRLSYTRIHAQSRNKRARLIVGERFVDEGTLLSINTPIVSLIDISSLVAVIHVTERDYYKLKVGQPVNVTAEAIRNRTMKGRITRIAPVIKESSREATVEIEVSNPGEILKPGLFIRAEIEFAAHYNAVVIPQSALVKRNGVTGVFRADLAENKARFIRIEQGISNNGLVEVLAPRLSGEVITIGHHLLEEGSKILVPNRKPNSRPAKNGTQAVKKRPQG